MVHNVAQVSLAGKLAEARREGLDHLVEPLEVHLDVVVAVDHNVRLLQRIHALQPEAKKAAEEHDGRVGRRAGAVDQRVALPVVRGEPCETLGVAADVGDGAREHVHILDQIRVCAVGPVGNEVVERRGELSSAGRRLLDLRQHVGRRRVLVAGLHGGVELVHGVVDTLDARLEDRVNDLVDLL